MVQTNKVLMVSAKIQKYKYSKAGRRNSLVFFFFFPLGLHDLLTVLIIPDVKMLVAHQPETVFAHMCSGAVASTAESRQNFRVDQLVVY